MARLTTARRNALPDSAFADPVHRAYPIDVPGDGGSHARNAKARASEFASPALKAKVDAKADRRIGQTGAGGRPRKVVHGHGGAKKTGKGRAAGW